MVFFSVNCWSCRFLGRMLPVFAALATAPAAFSETRTRRPTGQFVERLTDRVPTSGFLVAGVQLGRSSGIYARDLATMNSQEFAVRTVVSSQCDDAAEGPLVPAGLSSAKNVDVLLVLTNPGDARVSARLISRAGESLTGAATRCRNAERGPNIVFSQVCELSLGAEVKAGAAVLELTVVELTDGRTFRRFDIEIPGR